MPDPTQYKMRSLRGMIDHNGQLYGPSEAPVAVPLALADRIDAARKANGEEPPAPEDELPVVFAESPTPTIPDSVAAILGTHADNQADHINTLKGTVHMQADMIYSQQREIEELRAALARKNAPSVTVSAPAITPTPEPTDAPPRTPPPPSVPVAPAADNTPAQTPAPDANPGNGPTILTSQTGNDANAASADQAGATDTPTDGPRIRGRSNPAA